MTIRIKKKMKLTLPYSHFSTCPPARPCNGFTLIELVAVLAVMSFCAFMSAGIFIDKTDQECLNRTVFKMEEIKKALLGVYSRKVDLRQRFGGFISHMGGGPPLNDDGQPEGLWKWEQPEDDDGWKGEFRIKNYDMSENGYLVGSRAEGSWPAIGTGQKNWTYMGWWGPYIEPPKDGILRDGWGNPFIFEVSNGDLQITSPGANGVVNENDKGYDEDITMIIMRNMYMCSVAGYVDVSRYSHGRGDGLSSPETTSGMLKVENLRVVMHYPVINDQGHVVDHREFLDDNNIEEDGYFRIEDVPAGFRFIMAWEEKNGDGHCYNKIYMGFEECTVYEKVKNLMTYLEPGENWIGHMALQRDNTVKMGSFGDSTIYPKD